MKLKLDPKRFKQFKYSGYLLDLLETCIFRTFNFPFTSYFAPPPPFLGGKWLVKFSTLGNGATILSITAAPPYSFVLCTIHYGLSFVHNTLNFMSSLIKIIFSLWTDRETLAHFKLTGTFD